MLCRDLTDDLTEAGEFTPRSKAASTPPERHLLLFPRSLLPVYGGCGASEERGWRGDHVHTQLRGHDRGAVPRPQRGAQPPLAHLARHRYCLSLACF